MRMGQIGFVKDFETFKEQFKGLVKDLENEGFLTEEESKEFTTKLEKEELVISIIGQMKYGKSTFLNAFIFGKPILPVSDTPMTAALTAITYGEKPKIEIEFYTAQEWKKLEEMLKTALDEEVKKAIEETIQMAKKRLGNEMYNFLGKKETIPLKNSSPKELEETLREYVGTDGRFAPIVKMVTIYLNNENLKSLKIVDTPGFNDPIESRNQRALNFLRKSDVAILFLYAQRPFDREDKNLIVGKLADAGIGKVVVVINKADLLLSEQGTIEKVKEFVEKQYKKAILEDSKLSNSTVGKILLEAPIIPISSLMALIARMPKELLEKEEYEDYKWYYENFLEELPFIKSDKDLEEYSQIKLLEEEIRKIIREEKIRILKDKLKTELIGTLQEKRDKFREDLRKLKQDEFFIKQLEHLEEVKGIFIGIKRKIGENLIEIFEKSNNRIIERINVLHNDFLEDITKLRENCITSYCGAKNKWGAFSKSKRDFQNEFNKNFKLEYRNLIERNIVPKLRDLLTKTINELKNVLYDIKRLIIENIIEYELKETFKKARIKISDSTFFGLSKQDINDIFKEVEEFLKLDFENEFRSLINPSKLTIDTGWWIFGASKEEAFQEAEDIIYENFDRLKEKLKEIILDIETLSKRFFDPYNRENRIFEKIEEKLFRPIEDGIKEIEQKKDEVLKEMEKNRKLKETIEKRIRTFENKIKEVKQIMETL